MKILLVNPAASGPTAGALSQSMFPMPPLGIAYLAAIAERRGAEVFVEDQYASHIKTTDLAEIAVEKRVDIIGISCLSPNVPIVEALAREVRERLPECFIVLGNVHASYFAESMMEKLPIDAVVIGEGEITFDELLGALAEKGSLSDIAGLLWRDGEKIIRNPDRPLIEDLDSLPPPAWGYFRLDDYFAPPRLLFRDRVLAVQASRGCPYRCSYCAQNYFTPGLRRRSIATMVDEIEIMVEKHGVTCFGFQDAIFPLNDAEGYEFCRLLREKGLDKKVRWFTETRADMIGYDLLKEFKSCGCLYIMYGFESASKRLLEEADKKLDPEKAVEVMRQTRKAGLISYGLFMIGFPTETIAEANETIKFAKRLDCDVASFGRVTPYPGTELYERYKGDLDIEKAPWQWNNQYRPADGEKMWQLPGLTVDQITDLIGKAMISYYFRPKMIWRHLKLGTFSPWQMFLGAASLIYERLFRR